MKTQQVTGKFERSKARAAFLFNDGQFKPRAVRSAKVYRRQDKHRGRAENLS
jgi:hypothetical protein